MIKYFSVALFGGLGALCRYWISLAMENMTAIPIHTLFVNITGSFLITFIAALLLDSTRIPSFIKIGCTVGFLGGYTTFSTMSLELAEFLLTGDFLSFSIYLGLSLFLGIVAALLGYIIAGIIRDIIKKNSVSVDDDMRGA